MPTFVCQMVCLYKRILRLKPCSLQENVRVVHEIAQGNRVENAVKCRLQVLPGFSDFTSIKARALAGLFHAVCQFNAAFHQFDDASKCEFFGLAQKHMPALGPTDAARYASQAQLAQNLLAELRAYASLCSQLA